MGHLAGTSKLRPAVRRGFTLIELMVVLLILSLVLAILLPAIGGARTAAKKAAAMTQMSDLSKALGAFKLEKGTNPGYFSAQQMGAAANANRGFTSMKNILLDLCGGVTTQAADPANQIYDSVGPTATGTITVDVKQMGSTAGKTKAYYQPKADGFVAFTGAGQHGATAENAAIPDVVDPWGNPIMAWVEDERPSNVFAALDATTAARFYWNQNAGLLKATSMGKTSASQRYTNAAEPGSMIGEGAPNRPESLAGLLGNPAFPVANSNPLVPAQARGSIVFHSAGPDGVFLSTMDRGGKAGSVVQRVQYTSTPSDAVGDGFDDLVLGAGN